ncbi:hypothetical protein SNE40_005939 [Patella caerulea]|uniref:THAP-type domain-containing protein n=1 Tax=Patella caerulea TaxID=87958 RepID=A0AAN8K704_PATCE
MPTCCCVPGCSNRGGIAFPKRIILRSKWIQAVRRESLDGKHKLWEPKATSVVCHSHYKSSDYITTTAAGTGPLYRKIKADAVPSIFDWTSGNENKTEERQMRCILSSNTGMDSCSDEVIVCDTSSALDIGTECEITITESEIKDNEDSAADVCIKSYEDVLTNTDPRPNTSVDQFIDDDEGMLFYTGLASYTDFLHVLKSLGEASYHLNYLYSQVTNVSVENQLFFNTN